MARLLKRASELQVSTGIPPDSVSTEELAHIGAELGIEAMHLDQAIEELDRLDLDQG